MIDCEKKSMHGQYQKIVTYQQVEISEHIYAQGGSRHTRLETLIMPPYWRAHGLERNGRNYIHPSSLELCTQKSMGDQASFFLATNNKCNLQEISWFSVHSQDNRANSPAFLVSRGAKKLLYSMICCVSQAHALRYKDIKNMSFCLSKITTPLSEECAPFGRRRCIQGVGVFGRSDHGVQSRALLRALLFSSFTFLDRESSPQFS